MSVAINSHCVECLVKKHMTAIRELDRPELEGEFTRKMLSILADAAPNDNSCLLGQRINGLYQSVYGLPKDRFVEEKRLSNQFVLERLEGLRQRTLSAPDPVFTGLQYAILGNYLDFSALGKSVSFEKMEQMLRDPSQFAIDRQVYSQFCRDLEKATRLLYITDNAGELGFDWVLADAIAQRYPHLQITFCLRGMPVYNDATREDYDFFSIPYPFIENGSDIGGTQLSHVNRQTLEALGKADVILAKGMGNTETLYGSGYPIYFAFLIKCKRLQQVFDLPMLEAAFVREGRL